MESTKTKKGQDEFGDFQTPAALADEVVRLLAAQSLRPATIIEPTCGQGTFVHAALAHFPAAQVIGVEINPAYVAQLQQSLQGEKRATIERGDFFSVDWQTKLRQFPQPILLLGNPPWVTNAQQTLFQSDNLPQKSNFQRQAGIDAITGKSNFDISEWMLRQLVTLLDDRSAEIAMLCKTMVARKVLQAAWKESQRIAHAEIRQINAAEHFGVAVDACLLRCTLGGKPTTTCLTFDSLSADAPSRQLGIVDNTLVQDVAAYRRWRRLAGDSPYQWRSGVKHDCAKVMELRTAGTKLQNGLNETVELESDYLFPMLKSSEVAGGALQPKRQMLVPQRKTADPTDQIEQIAPRTWAYLQRHGEALDRRRSSIYRRRPRFSVFGVGDYAFAPWKVAISGFYKRLQFAVIGSAGDKPVVVDDTVYFLACQSEEEARLLATLLHSEPAQQFYASQVFWDAKRPITVDLLKRLNLAAVAQDLGLVKEFAKFASNNRASGDA
ncbi:DNA methyltransferase family protein [Blastopirellula retiformator]|uniref:Methyltransferase domain protein n=1 Tax=Blastopirellula retiformator TaxID=2527970 RepID=A0A5C5VLR7_9BACT|nr:class I SAM-dependent methyltransferase [Blastopirellula retiformator]TWT39013.1 Methyltransferase domain protein [Blastopirellula retiformator]